MLHPAFLPSPPPPTLFICKELKQMSLLESSVALEYFMASLCVAVPGGCQSRAASPAPSQLKRLTLALRRRN